MKQNSTVNAPLNRKSEMGVSRHEYRYATGLPVLMPVKNSSNFASVLGSSCLITDQKRLSFQLMNYRVLSNSDNAHTTAIRRLESAVSMRE